MSSKLQGTILIVDDEEQIIRALKSILVTRGYTVIVGRDGKEALNLAMDESPMLVILDVSLPDMTGFEVCRSLRDWYRGPILFLSVMNAEKDKITALDLGADDYLVKPFSAGELLARIRALIRRTDSREPDKSILEIGELVINIPKRTVSRSGVGIDLTPIEFDILVCLARNPDCVVTSTQLLTRVWGEEYAFDTPTLRVHISNLRKKIEPQPSLPTYIKTEPGVGFRIVTPTPSSQS